MASRKIKGTTHIRRKMRKGTKVAIGIAALVAVLTSGYLFVDKTDKGAEIKEKVSGIISSVGEYQMGEAAAQNLGKVSSHTIYGETSVISGTTGEIGGFIKSQQSNTNPENLIVMAEAYDGYIFDHWHIRYNTIGASPVDMPSSTLVIQATGSSFLVSDDMTCEAIYKKISSGGAVGGSEGRSYYTLHEYPSIGRHQMVGTDTSGNAYGWAYTNSTESSFGIDSGIAMKSITARIRVPYAEAEALWPHEDKTHSDTEHSDSYVNQKQYEASFRVVVFKNGSMMVDKEVTRKVHLQEYATTDDLVFEFKNTDRDLFENDGDILVDGTTGNAKDIRFEILPITRYNSKYAVFVDNSTGGTSSGTAMSTLPFTTTITAIPYEGYEFDYWGQKQIDSSSYSATNKKEERLSITVDNTYFFYAYFKKATHKVYASNLPSDGGTIEITGNVLDEGGSVVSETSAPGEADYVYTYNSDNPNKVETKPSVKVKITPTDGFHIESWSYTLEDIGTVTGTVEEFEIKDFEQDINLQVKYSNGKARIEVDSVPVTGGTATVKNDTVAGSTEKYDYEEFIPGKEDALLTATPADGYVFLYWKDSQNKQYKNSDGSNTLKLEKVGSSEKFTAYFAPSTIKIDTDVYPKKDASGDIIPGSVKVTGDKVTGSPPNYKTEPNTSVTIEAIEGDGYHFQKFVDSNGKEYNTNPLIKTDLIDDTVFTAVFIPDEFDITAISSPIIGGTVKVNDREGSNTVTYNQEVTILAEAKTGFIFKYFEDSSGTKYGGDVSTDKKKASFKFNAVNGAETYKAVFGLDAVVLKVTVDPKDKKTGETSYKAGGFKVDYTDTNGNPVNIPPTYVDWAADGSTNPDGTTNEKIKGQTSVKITAVPGDGYHFSKFVDTDGNVYTENPLVYPDLSEHKDVEVIFVPDSFTISAQATPVIGGTVTVNGRKGSNEVAYGESVTLTATPDTTGDRKFIFKYFEDQNGTKFTGKETSEGSGSYSFTFDAVNGAETYKAVFGLAKVSLNVKVDEVVSAGASYKTGGYRVDYTSSDSAPIVPGPYYNEETFNNVAGGKSVKITAVPGDGYHFAKFVDTDGNVYTENPLIYPDLSENKEVEIIFVPDSFTIYANATPVTGGTTLIEAWDKDAVAGSDPKTKREGSCEVGYGDKVKITANATGAYVFRYFEDPNGTKYGGEVAADKKSATFTFNAVNGTETYKAVFGMDEAAVSVKVDPNTTKTVDGIEKYIAGHAEVTYTKKSDGTSDTKVMDYGAATITDIKGGTSVKINAIAGDGYHFSKFVDTDGNVYSENPLVYPDLYEKKDVELIFVPDVFTIKANATPVTGGHVDVVVLDKDNNEISRREGSNDVSYNQLVRIVAKANGNFAFRHFVDPNGSTYAPTGTDSDGYPYFEFNAVNGSETYKAVFAMENVKVNVKVDPNKTTLFGNYKAGGYRIDYTNTSGQTDTTGEVYAADAGGITAKGQTSVKITAIPGDGYHFSKFVDTDGNTFNENPLVYPDLVENKDVEVIYVPDTFTINAQATPVIGGTADVTAGGSTREGSNTVSYDQEVTITAKPRPGFAFRYFEDPNGSKYSGEDIGGGNYAFTFRAVNGSETYKVVFAMDTVKLNVKVDPGTTDPSSGTYIAGKFEVNYTYTPEDSLLDVNKTVEGSRPNFSIDNIKGQTSVKIKAIELGGYKFSKFIDSEGNVWNDNPMVLGDLIENKEIEIIFVQDHWRIEGQSSPEAGGRITFNGIESGIDVDYGDHVLMEAKPNPGYEFKYFKDSNGNEFLSNPIEFDAINGSEKYTAYFVKDDVSVTIDLTPSGSGTVRFNEEPAVSTRTTYSADGRSNVRLTANPKEDHKFVNWKDQDGNTYPDNPLTIVDISRDLVFTAVFDSDSIGVKAVASPASGGHIRKLVNDDGSITLIASANRGYKFANWKKGEKLLTMGTKYTVGASDVHDGDVYTAYFKIDKDFDAKSDITKEKFYREWRKVLTPNYTVTRDSMKLLAMQTVAGLRQYDDATPALKSYGAVAEAQAYFDEKTAKDAARLDGIFGDSELMSAEGEELTPDKLPDYAEYEEIANEFTDKKFGDRYETEILTVKRVVQPDGFDNTKRTYLWRYTGAEYKDNIYLLYNIGGSKHDWATPIVDEDGVLKFTIDKLDDRDVVAVVRVKVK